VNLFLTFRVALRALLKNKMRACLTILGVVIGIASVTTMVSVGQSASHLIQGAFEGFGINVLIVFSNSRRDAGVQQGRGTIPKVTAEDGNAIQRECRSVLAVTPIVGASGQVIYRNMNWNLGGLTGVGTDYLTVRNWPLRRGGFFTERDISAAAKVCVVGHTIVTKLFQTTNPLGKSIRINNIPFEIIGILETKGANVVGDDQDNIIVAPYTTVRKRLQGSSFAGVNYLMVSARSPSRIATAKEEITRLLYERHHIPMGSPADFEVRDLTEQVKQFSTVIGVMTLLLASIAGISLVVGGVGIMNIMLVSVTERTREIGLRLAVGARQRDILRQFLVEAVCLSGLGGVIGVLFGVGASVLVTTILGKLTSGTAWPMAISFTAATVAMLFAGGVGVFFGYYPALRASRLDPIEALRYE